MPSQNTWKKNDLDSTLLVRRYENLRVIVAAGTSGAGLASALALVDAGVQKIVIMGRDHRQGAEATSKLLERRPDLKVLFISVDTTKSTPAEQAVREAYEYLGSIHVLVTSVSAPYDPELLHRTPIAEIPEILSMQAVPSMLVTRAVLPYMQAQGGGSIIVMASDSAEVATPAELVSDAASVIFSRTVAAEGKWDGIRVSAVTPSLLSGTSTSERARQGGCIEELSVEDSELRRLGKPDADDLASLVAFLCGPGRPG